MKLSFTKPSTFSRLMALGYAAAILVSNSAWADSTSRFKDDTRPPTYSDQPPLYDRYLAFRPFVPQGYELIENTPIYPGPNQEIQYLLRNIPENNIVIFTLQVDNQGHALGYRFSQKVSRQFQIDNFFGFNTYLTRQENIMTASRSEVVALNRLGEPVSHSRIINNYSGVLDGPTIVAEPRSRSVSGRFILHIGQLTGSNMLLANERNLPVSFLGNQSNGAISLENRRLVTINDAGETIRGYYSGAPYPNTFLAYLELCDNDMADHSPSNGRNCTFWISNPCNNTVNPMRIKSFNTRRQILAQVGPTSCLWTPNASGSGGAASMLAAGESGENMNNLGDVVGNRQLSASQTAAIIRRRDGQTFDLNSALVYPLANEMLAHAHTIYDDGRIGVRTDLGNYIVLLPQQQ